MACFNIFILYYLDRTVLIRYESLSDNEVVVVNTPSFADSISDGDVKLEKGKKLI